MATLKEQLNAVNEENERLRIAYDNFYASAVGKCYYCKHGEDNNMNFMSKYPCNACPFGYLFHHQRYWELADKFSLGAENARD